MSKTPVVVRAALGAFVSFVGLAVVWRSFRLGDWGDEHMEQMGAIVLSTVLLGATLGGIIGHRMARGRAERDRA